MTRDQFHSWIIHGDALNADTIAPLREVLDRFPYFQAAQVLLVKSLMAADHIDQAGQLQRAAVMVPDRRVLHRYLHGDPQAEPETGTMEMPEPDQQEGPDPWPEMPDTGSEPPATEKTHRPGFPDELIPEPVIYQLETATLPDIVPERKTEAEPEPEPDELPFAEWFDVLECKKGADKEEKGSAPENRPTPSGMELIEHFLARSKERSTQRAEFFNPRKVAAKADEEDFTVVSETLADIYFHQQKYELARKAYQVLSLKYPAKSVYFAARLKEINDLINAHS